MAILLGLWLAPAGPGLAQLRPKPVLQLGHSDAAQGAVWSADSRYLISFATPDAADPQIIIWDIASGALLDRVAVPAMPLPDHVPGKDEQCSPGNDPWTASGITIDAADRVTLWGSFPAPCGVLTSRSFALATRVWAPPVARTEADFPAFDGELPPSPDGRWKIVASGDHGRVVVPVDAGGALVQSYSLPPGRSEEAFLWWPDGRHFAIVDNFYALSLWDIASGRRERTIALRPPGARRLLPWLPSISRITASADRRTLTFWFLAGTPRGPGVLPVDLAVDTLKVAPPGAARLRGEADSFRLGGVEWPGWLSNDRRYVHVRRGIARTVALQPPPVLSAPGGAFLSVDVTQDGQHIAFLTDRIAGHNRLRILDVDGMSARTTGIFDASFDQVHWAGKDRVVLWHMPDDDVPQPAQMLLIGTGEGGGRQAYANPCDPHFFPNGMLTNGLCNGGTEARVPGIWVATFGTPGWRAVRLRDGLASIEATADAAPRAVAIHCADPQPARGICKANILELIDTRTMRVIGQARQSLPLMLEMRLSPDGLRLEARLYDENFAIRWIAVPLPRAIDGPFDIAPVAVALPATNPLYGPVRPLPRLGVEWQQTNRNSLRFARMTDHSELADLIAIGGDGFTVTTPFGTYDSSVRPDQARIDWLFPDAPMTSLPIEIFMRDYFEPNLLKRRLDCTAPGNCAKVFRAAPDLASLTRVLPEVRIESAVAGPEAGTAIVTITARGVIDPTGRPGSGLYNLRLYRDDRLVAQQGAPDPHADVDAGADSRALWRATTRLAGDDTTRVLRFSYTVKLMPDVAIHDTVFTAYAFNRDRVKSLSATAILTQPPAPPRTSRLWLLTIGIDAYGTGGFPNLRYAGADARAMADLLARVAPARPGAPRYEIHAESVIGTAAAPATRDRIRAAFAHLRARPGDVVLISYAGHGYTDARGRFALVPSDARRRGDLPDPASLISAGDLSEWLEPVDAGEIAFIIDACHSAASVRAGGFKPGPMGDPGLGQLAYDKGIRILAASQPDEVAMELTSVGHGLLTYTLVTQGARGGKADLDHDGFIRLDELLRYAAAAVPSTKLAAPGEDAGDASLLVDWGNDAARGRQKPSLFDYVGAPAEAGLRAVVPVAPKQRAQARSGSARRTG